MICTRIGWLYYRLTSSLFHCINVTIFLHVLILADAGFWILCFGLIFANKRDFVLQYVKKSRTLFWFCVSSLIFLVKKLKICEIAKLSTHKNIVMWKKAVRISILSGGDFSSTPVLASNATFTYTLKFWSPSQNSPTMKTRLPTLKEWILCLWRTRTPPVLMALWRTLSRTLVIYEL